MAAKFANDFDSRCRSMFVVEDPRNFSLADIYGLFMVFKWQINYRLGFSRNFALSRTKINLSFSTGLPVFANFEIVRRALFFLMFFVLDTFRLICVNRAIGYELLISWSFSMEFLLAHVFLFVKFKTVLSFQKVVWFLLFYFLLNTTIWFCLDDFPRPEELSCSSSSRTDLFLFSCSRELFDLLV